MGNLKDLKFSMSSQQTQDKHDKLLNVFDDKHGKLLNVFDFTLRYLHLSFVD